MASKRYECKELVGEGKTSLIYRGIDSVLDREVAIKCPRDEVAAKPEYRVMFAREAQKLASLEHPHVLSSFHALSNIDGLPMLMKRE
jgi:eukaryotic-like serine/threonine-protein kinase